MKTLKCLLIILIVSILFPYQRITGAETLQSQIDAAAENSLIKIQGGVYNEEIVISKPITIEGSSGSTIQSCGDKPTITIKGTNITVKQITVKKCSKAADATAIYLTGSKHTLENIQVDTEQTGIKLEQATQISILNNLIIGNGQGNGIDMWESSGNSVIATNLHHVRDGIYLENSNYNHLLRNNIEHSRYGVHVMFSDNVEIRGNTSQHNVTGAMIMETTGTNVWENNFSNNNKNVNAQGLLLYDAKETSVFQNNISYNKTGIYIEKSEKDKIYNNYVQGNYVGVQVKNAQNNFVYGNNFIGNVTEAQAINSTSNMFEKNYWDASLKLDMNGQGISSIPYKLDPYFLILTNDVPDYQVFFRSPGMFLLQRLLKSPDQAVLTDWKPLIKRTAASDNEAEHLKPTALIILSTVMILGSYILLLVGRKRI